MPASLASCCYSFFLYAAYAPPLVFTPSRFMTQADAGLQQQGDPSREEYAKTIVKNDKQ